MNYSKRLLSASIIAFFLACSGDFKEITDEERQARLPQLSSSSEGLSSSSSEVGVSSSDSSSSSSDGQSSSSAEQSSSSSSVGVSSSDSGSSSSEEQSSSSAEQSSSSFSDGNVYTYICNGKEYNPNTDDCESTVFVSCAGSFYNTETYFCYKNTTYEKCGGKPYYVDAQFCLGSEIKDKCDGKEYEAGQYCFMNAIHGNCEVTPYNTETHLCDSRNSTIYPFVTIGDQVWMAKNLNYDASSSKCGNGSSLSDANTATCDTYGRLYNWATAMNLNSSCNSNVCNSQVQPKHQGVCPFGWHLPSDAEWTTLEDYADGAETAGAKLKAKNGWDDYSSSSGNGTDDFGFSALPGGYGASDGSSGNVGIRGHWWSSTEVNASGAYRRNMHYDKISVIRDNSIKLSNLYPVRCVRN